MGFNSGFKGLQTGVISVYWACAVWPHARQSMVGSADGSALYARVRKWPNTDAVWPLTKPTATLKPEPTQHNSLNRLPDKEVQIKNITVYISGYTETNTTGMLSPPTVWHFSVAADIDSNVFDFYFLIWSLSRLLCCVGSGFNVATAWGNIQGSTGNHCCRAKANSVT